MRVIRRTPTPVVRKLAAAVKVEALPQIAIKIPRGTVVKCPTTEELVSDIIKATPRLRRPPRRDGYLHVSDLIGKNKCVRKIAIAGKYGTPVRPSRLSVFDRLVFAIGDAIHDMVKKIATEGAPDRIWGKWKCQCGHLFHDEPCLQSEIDPDDICELCHTGSVYYREVSVFNEEYGIVGNPDLLLYLTEVDAFHVTELKSIAHEAWEELARPMPEHVLQVVFYWFLMAMAGYRLTDRISVVYITKGYRFKGDAHKEFMIDPRAELHRLVPYLEDARAAKLSAEEERYPARKMCSNEFSSQAKKCEVCTTCFAVPG
jgi:hypothetical protein